MKKEKVDVKSQGKVVSSVEIPIYETIEEASKALTPVKCLELINRMNKTDLVNTERATKTRKASPVTQLTRLAKTNPEIEKALNELLKKHGLAPAPEAPKA